MSRKPLKTSVWAGGSLLILISAAIAYLFPQPSFLSTNSASLEGVEIAGDDAGSAAGGVIGWKLLQTFDYKANVVPPGLQDYLNKKVKIPGFAVPLSNNFQAIDEILLVPNQLACIHVPAPPPHLVVFVKLRQPLPIEALDGPLWAEGILAIKHTNSMYGAAAYEMDGLSMKPYQY